MELVVQREAAYGGAADSPAPSHTIASEYLSRRYRRIGQITFGVPFAGTVAAFATLPHVAPAAPVLWLALGLYCCAVLGLEAGYHRHLSHGAFAAQPSLRSLLLLFAAWGWSGPPIYWASTHRLHHGNSDRAGDPHSPHLMGPGKRNFLRGLWHAQVGWMLNAKVVTNSSVLARDLLKDRLVVFFNGAYWWFALSSLVVSATLGWLIVPTATGALVGLLWIGFVRIFLVQFCYTGGLNSICHAFGHRTFRTHDSSVNNVWLVLPTLGQSWHNNHHAFPSSARLDLLWYQVDPVGLVLRMFAAIKLASRLNVPSVAAISSKRLRPAANTSERNASQ